MSVQATAAGHCGRELPKVAEMTTTEIGRIGLMHSQTGLKLSPGWSMCVVMGS